MPELPEVETIVRQLQFVMRRAKITAVDVRLPKMVKLPVRRLRQALVHAHIVHIHRRAKLVLLDFSSGQTLLIHLKMSGQLIWKPIRGRLRVGGHPIPRGIENLPNHYSHVIITTNRGTLFFNDQRQFGFVKMIPTAELESWLEDQGYGPEPLDSLFTVEHFLVILRQHQRKRIKPMLLDQQAIAGIGNIYADETCFIARVRPTRKVSSLTLVERTALYHGLRSILTLAINKKGTTADAYRTATGDKGSMMPFLKVYGRDGLKCKRCGRIITKTVLAGRGTHYCANCQQ